MVYRCESALIATDSTTFDAEKRCLQRIASPNEKLDYINRRQRATSNDGVCGATALDA